ncbi:hypothetical protein KPA96_13890 [Burkholderia cenocepacia]|uniref:hypothetical protein n=1 Tax=Burkholderia cenocepacia TaxID=95486 RepID=UPI00285A52FE|nr:hypothetical protein [Burkholderia cenocepacia]MDR8076749.1 hypothetical protein [Burkholderia cenocepacia]
MAAKHPALKKTGETIYWSPNHIQKKFIERKRSEGKSLLPKTHVVDTAVDLYIQNEHLPSLIESVVNMQETIKILTEKLAEKEIENQLINAKLSLILKKLGD